MDEYSKYNRKKPQKGKIKPRIFQNGKSNTLFSGKTGQEKEMAQIKQG